MKEYLLEVGMEEIPARFLVKLSHQLAEACGQFLQDKRITYQGIKSFATPRRLAVKIRGLADQQAALVEEVRGPSAKVAYDEAGELTKAALGFLRGQKCTEEDLFTQEVKGTDYVFVKKTAPQKSLETVLAQLADVLANLHFPVTMRWSDLNLEYIRPVHWILSLLEDQVIPFEFAGVQADRYSYGHRFLTDGKPFSIDEVSDYELELEKHYVLADFNQRKAVIEDQIKTLAKQNNWLVPESSDLLEEVTAIVEWPTAFAGDFDSSYLKLPQEMIITAMRDHQRYFYALDPSSRDLLPVFISVRNGNPDHIEQVIKGNQKVLRARLADGLFFFEEDLKLSLDDHLQKLESLKEHFKLASLKDKQDRVEALIGQIGQALDLDQDMLETASQASRIYKFDLVTLAVGEFSELQGIMGGIYARHYGQAQDVCQAISQQYLPSSAGGDLPTSPAGALLALADKLDSLIAYFGVGLIPTGSNDPYALRRQAMGLVEILIDRAWSFDLLRLMSQVLRDREDRQEIITTLKQFILARLQVYLEQKAVDYDLIEAGLSQPQLNPVRLVQTAQHLQSMRQQSPDKLAQLAEHSSRVVNLGEKVAELETIKIELAESNLEKELIQSIMALQDLTDVQAEFEALLELTPTIAAYFDQHMVNAENENIRYNRYQMMGQLTQMILRLLDPRVIVYK